MKRASGILYIGGASASGKTYALERIASDLQIPALHLDRLYDSLQPKLPDEVMRRPVMKAMSLRLGPRVFTRTVRWRHDD